MSRFDYIKYDEKSQKLQIQFKEQMQAIEKYCLSGVEALVTLDKMLVGMQDSRAKRNAQEKVDHLNHTDIATPEWLTLLEEVYMWIGKAIRDDQICRGGKNELQEERGAE